MGGQVLAEILMGRTATGNAAVGVAGVPGYVTKNAPGNLRSSTTPFITSYQVGTTEEETPEVVEAVVPEEVIPVSESVDKSTRNHREYSHHSHHGVTREVLPTIPVTVPDSLVVKSAGTTKMPKTPKVEKLVSKIPGYHTVNNERTVGKGIAEGPKINQEKGGTGGIASGPRTAIKRVGVGHSLLSEDPNYSYSIGDITSVPEGSPRIVTVERKTTVEGFDGAVMAGLPAYPAITKPVVSIEVGDSQRVFDLEKPEDLQSFIDYWKTRPLDEKVTVNGLGPNTATQSYDNIQSLKYIPEDQVKMYAFWTNPVKTYTDPSTGTVLTFDFSTEEGKKAWTDFRVNPALVIYGDNPSSTEGGSAPMMVRQKPQDPKAEPAEWSQAPGFPVDVPSTGRASKGRFEPMPPVSWDILVGTRLEGTIPIEYQVYKSLNKGVEQAKAYAEQKAAYEVELAKQPVTKYAVPKGPVSPYFNIDSKQLEILAGTKDFAQNFTPAQLTQMGERIAAGEMSPLARAIYLVLKSKPGITITSLADAFGVTEEDVTQAMVLVDKFIQGAKAKAYATSR